VGGEIVLEQQVWEEALWLEEMREEFETLDALLATSVLEMERGGAALRTRGGRSKRRGATRRRIWWT
jgi:hypothetical protein